MIKKLFSYILSTSLLVSSEQSLFASTTDLKNKVENLENQKINSSLVSSKTSNLKDKKVYLLRDNPRLKKGLTYSLGATALLTLTAIGIKEKFFNQTNIKLLLSELEKENLGITNDNIEHVVACSAIQGLSYLEGANRCEQKGRHERLLNELIETLILVRSYDNLNIFFKLGAKKDWKKPELLLVSRTQGDDMVQKIAHIFETNNPQTVKPIKEAKEYMNLIKDEFNKLSKDQILERLDKISEKNNKNVNIKISLLISLMILDMSANELTKLVNNAVTNMYSALKEKH